MLRGKAYYISPGGFLYRKDPGIEEEGATSAATLRMWSGNTWKKVRRSRYCYLATTERTRRAVKRRYLLGSQAASTMQRCA